MLKPIPSCHRRPMVGPRIVLLLSAGLSSAAWGQVPTFAPKTDYPASADSQSVALADVTGDGRLDIVTTNPNGSSVSVLAGKAGGGFEARVDHTTDQNPYYVALGDVTGDGRPDIVTANFFEYTVSVLAGRVGGGFDGRVEYAVGGGAHSVALADVTGDGRLDIVTANEYDRTVTVLTGRAGGGFDAKRDYATGAVPGHLALGDVTGDGRPDIVTANIYTSPTSSASSVSVLAGKTGGFETWVSYPMPGGTTSVALGDVTGDGRPDIVTANTGANAVTVLAGKAGGFEPRVTYPGILGALSVALADVSGDGRLDIITANADAAANSVSVLVGKPGGGFEGKRDFATGPIPYNVAVGDVTGDGKPDIVTANFKGSSVSVLVNTTAAVLAAAPALSVPKIEVFPNPATQRFVVQLPALAGARTVEATLCNSLGQIVRRQSVPYAATGARFVVAAEGLRAGVYALQLRAAGVTLTKQVVLH